MSIELKLERPTGNTVTVSVNSDKESPLLCKWRG